MKIFTNKIILSFLVLFATLMIADISATAVGSPAQTPVWAFNGAYADYKISNNSVSNVYINYEISDLNTSNQSFYVSVTVSGKISNSTVFMSTTPGYGTFTNPSPLMALNVTSLTLVNKGITPPSFNLPNASVSTSQTITVSAGTFACDKLSASTTGPYGSFNFAFWVSSVSGLLIKFNFQHSGSNLNSTSSSFNAELTKTNIGTNSGGILGGIPILLIFLIIGIIVIIAIASVLAINKKKKRF